MKQIDRTRADGAAARHRNLGLSHSRQQRRHHPEARPHLGNEIVGRRRIHNMFCGDVDGAALIGVVTGPLAGNHHIHAMVAENALQLDDVGEPWNIVEDQGVLGQQTCDHQGECCVLGARNRNCAVQTLSANYAYPVHARPVPSSRSGYDGGDIETRAPLPQCQY